MPSITLIENEYITVEYWGDKKFIRHTIHQPIDPDHLKPALNTGTDALAQYGAHKWLSDDRKNGPLSSDLEAWGTNEWIPRTIAAGWQYWANVVPEQLIAAGTMLPAIEFLFNAGLRLMVFSTVEGAIQWLDDIESTLPSKVVAEVYKRE